MQDGTLIPLPGALPVPAVDERLAARMGAAHAVRRAAMELHGEQRVFTHAQSWTELENWPGGRQLIRLALGAVGLHGRARRNARRIAVRRHDLAVAGLPGEFDGYTILHLSDLHIDIAPDMPAVLGASVNACHYDACVLTGDYRAETYGPHAATVEGLQALMQSLRPPVFGVFGNHDTLHLLAPMEALGIRMLMNESARLERGDGALYLAGVDDPHYFRTDDLARAREGIPAAAPSILLAHSPEIYARAAAAGFGAMLCGHTHGGQLCLPGGFALRSNAPCPRRLWAGPWRHGRMSGYTSVGCGTCVVDLRLNCRPEITLHRLCAG
jgi:hypothetical protein